MQSQTNHKMNSRRPSLREVDPTNFKAAEQSARLFAADFDHMSLKLKKGVEATKAGLNFVERWLRIEFNQCRAFDDLLESRTARGLLANDMEPVAELGVAWTTFISELKEANERRKEVAHAVKETIVTKLSAFNDDLGSRQEAAINQGKKVISELTASYTTLAQKQVVFQKMCEEVAEDIEFVAPAYEPQTKDELQEVLQLVEPNLAARVGLRDAMDKDPASMTPPQKRKMAGRVAAVASPSVQQLLDRKKTHVDAYKQDIAKVNDLYSKNLSGQLPTILSSLHDTEIERVAHMKYCIGHMTNGIISQCKKVTFSLSRDMLSNIVAEGIITASLSVVFPPRLRFHDATAIEMSPQKTRSTASLISNSSNIGQQPHSRTSSTTGDGNNGYNNSNNSTTTCSQQPTAPSTPPTRKASAGVTGQQGLRTPNNNTSHHQSNDPREMKTPQHQHQHHLQQQQQQQQQYTTPQQQQQTPRRRRTPMSQRPRSGDWSQQMQSPQSPLGRPTSSRDQMKSPYFDESKIRLERNSSVPGFALVSRPSMKSLTNTDNLACTIPSRRRSISDPNTFKQKLSAP